MFEFLHDIRIVAILVYSLAFFKRKDFFGGETLVDYLSFLVCGGVILRMVCSVILFVTLIPLCVCNSRYFWCHLLIYFHFAEQKKEEKRSSK